MDVAQLGQPDWDELPPPRRWHLSQAPYSEIDKATYVQCSMCIDPIDWAKLPDYERGDTTEGAKTAACVGDACEL